MTQKERATEAAAKILEAFESGTVPQALSHVFLATPSVPGPRPSDRWSWGNRMLAVIQGHIDSRGFKQWKNAGRSVAKGERARYILGPMTVKVDDETEPTGKRTIIVGFRGIPVFGLDQTNGPELEGETDPVEFIESLPVIEVARAWGVKVRAQGGTNGSAGSTDGKSVIHLAVENLSTWAHELVHVADARNVGSLKPGQHLDQEVVAELGGAVLLECLGMEREADRGGAWEYVKHYAGDDKAAIRACNELLTRTCEAVALILETADAVAAKEVA